jgi:hypothetical protein
MTNGFLPIPKLSFYEAARTASRFDAVSAVAFLSMFFLDW